MIRNQQLQDLLNEHKNVTITLTQDQLNALAGLCYQAYDAKDVVNYAFFKRIGDKLVKAKS